MPPLYVVKQGAKLRIKNRRLEITFKKETLNSLPINHISQVILYGNIGLTTPAMGTLLKKNIEVTLLTRKGDFKGVLRGKVSPHVPLRKAQYALLDDHDFALDLAKLFVRAKLNHQRTILNRQKTRSSNQVVKEEIAILHESLNRIPHKEKLSSLRGLEGSASAAYFRAYRSLFDSEWRFQKRNRRPPRDPINVLLSFGYTLITKAASAAVQTVGMDVYAGYLHTVDYNRPSLALDLVEEFRPVIDGIILWCINSAQITPSNFKPGKGRYPVKLDDEGMKTFLQAYEKRMKRRFSHPVLGKKLTLRQCMIEQARQVAKSIQERKPQYQAMGFR